MKMQLLLFECDNKGYDADNHTDYGTADREPGIARTALHTLTLVGLDIDDVVLLQVIGRRVEYSLIVEQVDLVCCPPAILFANDQDIVAVGAVCQVAGLAESFQDGEAFTLIGLGAWRFIVVRWLS